MVLLAISASLASPALLSCARPGRSSAEPPPLSRRALLPLPLLPLLLPAAAPAADTFEYFENGEAKQLTEIQARDALTKKVEAATAAGKGLDLERRGQFNEKALFSEDFYFKYGLRPSASEALASPYVPPQGELPFSPLDLADADLPALVASCRIDHSVAPIPGTRGGSRARCASGG